MVDSCAGVSLQRGSRWLGYDLAIGNLAGLEGCRSVVVALLAWISLLVMQLHSSKEMRSVPFFEITLFNV